MHEWTHQTVGFYGRKGWAMPDIHAPASYGYLREQYGKIFLSDVMRGRVPTSSGYIGLNSTVWASGTPTGNYTPRTVSASPSTTTSYVGTAQTVTTTYSDSNGWKDIRWASARLISSNGRPAVSLLYNRSTNRMYVRSRDGARWIGGYAPGSSNTITPGHATVKVNASSVSGSDNTLTVRWSVAFESPTRGGNYGVNLRVTGRNGAIAQRLGVATRYVR